MKKYKIGILASASILALGTFAFAVPIFAEAPDCSAVTTQNRLTTCIESDQHITLGGDLELESNVTIKGGKNVTIDLAGHNIIRRGNSVAFQIREGNLSLEGSGIVKRIGQDDTESRSTIRIYGKTEPQSTPTSTLSVGKNVLIKNNDDAAIYVEDNNTDAYYGIAVDFAGSIFAPEGIAVSKNIDITDGIPIINIKDGSTITTGNRAIVAEGYAGWNIGKATLMADTGIALVQGEFYIDGANVAAVGDNNAEIYPNGELVKMPSTGAAIQIQATKDKTDKSSFYVRSGSFTSAAGFAIAEYAGDSFSDNVTLKTFKIYEGTFQGTEDFENSVATSTTGALFWYHGDGRMMEAGGRVIEAEDLYDSHKMTIVRFANKVTGLDELVELVYGMEEILPVFSPYDGLDEYDAEDLKNSEYKNSQIVNVFDVSLRGFESDIGEPAPGTSKPYVLIADTSEEHPITFNLNFPEVNSVEDGYTREYYMLNFHRNSRTGEYEIEKLPIEFDDEGTTFSFSTHKFSTFALAYADTKLDPEPEEPEPTPTPEPEEPEPTPTPEEEEQVPDAPNTGFGILGDKSFSSVVSLFVTMAIVALTVISVRRLSRK